MTVSDTTDGIRALRRPTVSTRRPRQGAPNGNADGHHGGSSPGGGIALVQGEDDVQGQQHAGRGVRECGQSCPPAAAAGWAGRRAAPGRERNSRKILWSAAAAPRDHPAWPRLLDCAPQLDFDRVNPLPKQYIPGPVRPGARPRAPGPRRRQGRPQGRAPPAVRARRRRRAHGRRSAVVEATPPPGRSSMFRTAGKPAAASAHGLPASSSSA